jgi:hypothetical protein
MLSTISLDGHNDVGRSTHDGGVGCGWMFVWNVLWQKLVLQVTEGSRATIVAGNYRFLFEGQR